MYKIVQFDCKNKLITSGKTLVLWWGVIVTTGRVSQKPRKSMIKSRRYQHVLRLTGLKLNILKATDKTCGDALMKFHPGKLHVVTSSPEAWLEAIQVHLDIEGHWCFWSIWLDINVNVDISVNMAKKKWFVIPGNPTPLYPDASSQEKWNAKGESIIKA